MTADSKLDEVVLYDLVLELDPDTGAVGLTGEVFGMDRDEVFKHLRLAAGLMLTKLPRSYQLKMLEQGQANTTPFPIRHRATQDGDELTVSMEAADDDTPFDMKAAIYRTLSACRSYRLGQFDDQSTDTVSCRKCDQFAADLASTDNLIGAQS